MASLRVDHEEEINEVESHVHVCHICAKAYKFDRIFANTTPFLSQQDTVTDLEFVERGEWFLERGASKLKV